jgi:hypothetical protein
VKKIARAPLRVPEGLIHAAVSVVANDNHLSLRSYRELIGERTCHNDFAVGLDGSGGQRVTVFLLGR